MKFSVFFIILWAGMASVLNAQFKTKLKSHNAKINQSKIDKTSLISLDTFYCSGIKCAIIRNFDSNLKNGIFTNYFNGDTIIRVTLIEEKEGELTVFFHHYEFPTLKVTSDVRYKDGDVDFCQKICDYNLVNEHGIDTFKVEAFVAIKGEKLKNVIVKNNYRMVERNRDAKIKIIENDIYQDSLIIGSYEFIKVPGPNETVLNQIQVYNTQKHKVSISTEIAPGKNEWRMLTNVDGKYHLVKTKGPIEKVIYEILGFLIASNYL